MQHCKSLDFVHTIKETTHLEQLPFTILVARAFSSSLPEKPGSWSINCQLTANATQEFPHIHNRFCFYEIFANVFTIGIYDRYCNCPLFAHLKLLLVNQDKNSSIDITVKLISANCVNAPFTFSLSNAF